MSGVGCFANVIVDIAADSVRNRLFTYSVPHSLAKDIATGVPVLVPFGKSKAIAGYVISLSPEQPKSISQEIEMKEIMAILDVQPFFDSQYIDFLNWTAEYYLSNLMDVITAALPACLVPRLKQSILLKNSHIDKGLLTDEESHIVSLLEKSKRHELATSSLKQDWYRISQQKESQFYKALNNLLGNNLIERKTAISFSNKAKTETFIALTGNDPASKSGKRIVSVLKEKGGKLSQKNLIKFAQTTSKTIATLAEEGVLTLHKLDQIRDPLLYLREQMLSSAEIPNLTNDQSKVFEILKTAMIDKLNIDQVDGELEDNIQVPWLLHGVTGSGKTEIYLQLIEQALLKNRSALLMVPEIALTPQLAERLVNRFGDLVGVWHSGLSDGERFDTWRRLQNGNLKILLGARSAVLVNIPNLGLIIIDEEHDASYKQTSPSPRYNAKTLALEKARRSGAMVLYGSATPDVSTYYKAQLDNKVLSMSRRIHDQGFPKTVIVDMRQEFNIGNRSIFSKILAEALRDRLEKKEQSILLLNRRGYASHVFCRACGYVSSCKNCSVPMVYHRLATSSNGNAEIDLLVCHHCGFKQSLSQVCNSCKQPFLKNYGLGTQRVEIELQKLLPQAKLIRLDSDIAQKKGAHQEVFSKFANGQADVLIGTQMIAKGLDNANVTLVGILAADAAFNLSDYRCTERGFQLLTQVAGRAGRGHLPGKVIVQTFNPQMPALKFSLSHDYDNFYQAELPTRQSYMYPPFSQLVRVVLAGADLDKTIHASEKLTEELSNYLADIAEASEIAVLGPAPCLLEKLHGKYRQHLIIKNNTGESGHKIIASFFKRKNSVKDVQIAVDIDAIDLL